MTKHVCHHCGGTGSVSQGVTVSLDRNEVSVAWAEPRIHLNPRETELLYTLARDMPTTVAFDRLIMAVWASEEPRGVRDNLKVHVCRINKKIAVLGLRVTNVHDYGYYLARALAPAAKQVVAALSGRIRSVALA